MNSHCALSCPVRLYETLVRCGRYVFMRLDSGFVYIAHGFNRRACTQRLMCELRHRTDRPVSLPLGDQM
jgi:hypothetical protein